MNISTCSQSRAFMDDATYLPQPYPADRRYPVPNPGYDTYPNTGYPGIRTIYTAFGPTNYADSVVEPTNPNHEPIDEVGVALLPPLSFVNGQPVYTPAPKPTAPEYAPVSTLNHLTMIPASGQYNKLAMPPAVDLCRDYWNKGMVLRDAERVSASIWGKGDDFVLRRPMPSILINGVPSSSPVGDEGRDNGAGAMGLWGLGAIVVVLAFLHSK